nr:hypothetical protein [uncultured Sphingosinicella sp.]
MVVAFMAAPPLTFALVLAWEYLSGHGTLSSTFHPEAIAYLLAFIAIGLLPLITGLLLAWFAHASLPFLTPVVRSSVAVLISAVSSAALYFPSFQFITGESSNSLLLLLAAFQGCVGGLVMMTLFHNRAKATLQWLTLTTSSSSAPDPAATSPPFARRSSR